MSLWKRHVIPPCVCAASFWLLQSPPAVSESVMYKPTGLMKIQYGSGHLQLLLRRAGFPLMSTYR